MGWPLFITLIVLITILTVVLVLFILLARKLHKTIRKIGSFRCRYRPDVHSGWTEGVAVYGTESLAWYRLVSLAQHPQKEWSRRDFVIKQAIACGEDDTGQIVELRIHADGHRFFLEVSDADYNGLVSWIEAGPPRSKGIL